MSRKSTSKSTEVELPPVRPWAGMLGFVDAREQVARLLREDRWPQVVLFEGREGIGKRLFLAAVCGLIYCDEQSACGRCAGCMAVQKGYHPDLLWIESSGTLKIAEVEQLQEHLSYRGQGHNLSAPWRVVVMADIEGLTEQAANRLLKILEEPPAQSRILLSTSRATQLLPTILSRTVRWRLQPPPIEASLEWLDCRAREAGWVFEAKQLRDSLERCELSPGRAWRTLQQQQSQDSGQIKRLESLLLQAPSSKNLQDLQDILKQLGWKADELGQHFELLLNRYYKWVLGVTPSQSGGIPAPDYARIRHWRTVLRNVHKAGGHGRNNLNALLVAEALVAPSFSLEIT